MRLAALIKERLALDVSMRPGVTGQFEVKVNGKTLATRGGNWFTRRFRAGYPDFDHVVEVVQERLSDG